MSPAGAGVVVVVVEVGVVGATETRATALVGYSVTVLTSSENCLARPGETVNKVYYLSDHSESPEGISLPV